MTDVLQTPEIYRERALLLRAKAKAYSSELRSQILEIAGHYEALADSVVIIEKNKKKLP
jgi:hypothetical protein